jgi:phosphatidylglycerophosphatase C
MPELNPPPATTPGATAVVAAFDFDGTLTYRDTLGPFLIRSLGWPKFLRALFLSAPWLAAYVLRLMSNHEAKARLLQVSLGGATQEGIARHAQEFVHKYLPAEWQVWALQQLVQHQKAGHRCVIVSASPGIYMHAVAKSLGVDVVLCTEMEVKDGRYTGHMATANCHGQEKVRRLQAWLTETFAAEAAAPTLHAYGDTKGDLPMLRLANEAWYREKRWVRS